MQEYLHWLPQQNCEHIHFLFLIHITYVISFNQNISEEILMGATGATVRLETCLLRNMKSNMKRLRYRDQLTDVGY